MNQFTDLRDLPPVLLAAAGLPTPAAMQGRSLLPLVRRQPVEWPDDVFIQISEEQYLYDLGAPATPIERHDADTDGPRHGARRMTSATVS